MAVNMFLNSVKKYLKDIFFPIFCAECGQEGEWWCATCRRDKIDFVFQKSDGPLNGTAAFLNYQEGEAVGDLIKQFKYHNASDMEHLWKEIILEKEKLLIQFLGQNDLEKTNLAVIPVPLHPRRERERGYNQAEILANAVGGVLQKAGMGAGADKSVLLRKKYTAQQAKLNREERINNVNGVFECKKIVPENVVIVDDVYTTGATMLECAKVLRENGAKKVWGVTLARGG